MSSDYLRISKAYFLSELIKKNKAISVEFYQFYTTYSTKPMDHLEADLSQDSGMLIIEKQEKVGSSNLCYNADGLPRKINSTIITPMKKYPNLLGKFMKAAPGLFKRSYFKLSDPLFMLKLHHCLRQQPNHIQLFNQLTQKTWNFIVTQKEKIDSSQDERLWERNSAYMRKLAAFKILLFYLRENKDLFKDKLDTIIRSGIYGIHKGKCNSKRANIDRYTQEGNSTKQSKMAHSQSQGTVDHI